MTAEEGCAPAVESPPTPVSEPVSPVIQAPVTAGRWDVVCNRCGRVFSRLWSEGPPDEMFMTFLVCETCGNGKKYREGFNLLFVARVE